MKVFTVSGILIIAVFRSFTQSPAVEWDNTIGGDQNDYLNSVQQTVDGGYILGGYSGSGISADKTDAGYGTDYWVVKLNSSGSIQWQNAIGGTSDDYLYCVRQTSDAGYILGGNSLSGVSGDKTDTSISMLSNDLWVVKLDNSGNIQWQNDIGGSQNDVLNCINQTIDGVSTPFFRQIKNRQNFIHHDLRC